MADEPYAERGEEMVFIRPGQSAPPVLVSMPDGTVITMQQFEQMEAENAYNGDDEEDAR